MKNESVRFYYDLLNNKRFSLIVKCLSDKILAVLLLALLSPIFVIVAIAIKIDSKGPVMFRQIRVTQYGRCFRIYKFRTMVESEDNNLLITTSHDKRITRVGRILRKYRIDEIPQLLNIISGDMTFVGTRPEVVKYVDAYTDEMLATLLLPAGVTSEASIKYRDEEALLDNMSNTEAIYLNEVLPSKMKYNLESIAKFSLVRDLSTVLKTVAAVLRLT